MNSKRLLKKFAEFVTPESAQALLDRADFQGEVKIRQVEYILVNINDENAEDIERIIRAIAEVFSARGVVLGEVCSSLITGYFGTVEGDRKGAIHRSRVTQ